VGRPSWTRPPALDGTTLAPARAAALFDRGGFAHALTSPPPLPTPPFLQEELNAWSATYFARLLAEHNNKKAAQKAAGGAGHEEHGAAAEEEGKAQ
jgi:hypothetical protein